MRSKAVHIIGGGLAGSEAAWQLAQADVPVILHEMRPVTKTDVHQGDGLAELVCSNSFRSDDPQNNAVGLIHEEMRRMDSLIMACADHHKLPAGGALAVDREAFSNAVTQKLENHEHITLSREEISSIPTQDDAWDNVIIATGPLTSPALSDAIATMTGDNGLAFFDAIAPIIYKDSIDFDKVWYQSRYDKGDGADYINCPLDEDQYNNFIDALLTGEKTNFKQWEKNTPYFSGCLPIEVMAERGRETLRFGPMKPVGLTNPHNPTVKAYGIIQLRQDNALGSLWNMVGFQTKLKYQAQKDIFRTIPGLENARFARLGGLHRNTFLNSPELLDSQLRLKTDPRLRFAGQITGVEGYVESAAMGLLAGRFSAAERKGQAITPPPPTTAFGALIEHITGGHISEKKKGKAGSFQPMNVNFGLFPPIEKMPREVDGKRIKGKEKGRLRKQLMAKRALEDLDIWLNH